MENTQELKNKTLFGFFWQFGQKISTQAISFVISVVLARLLMPEDYGAIALASMFLILLGNFVDNGLGTALIQKKDVDEKDFSTAFYAGIIMSVLIYSLVLITSPFVAQSFNNPQLTSILRIMGLSLPIGALSGVQNAFISRNMQFKKYFIASLYGTVISGIVGLIMAYSNCGAWALVGQALTNSIINTIVLYCIISWHPKWLFSYKRFKILFSFGWKIMASSLIGTFFSQMKGYTIGFKYSSTDLAFYNRGEGLPSILYNNINSTISTVLFPAMSRIQNDREAVKRALRRSMKVSSFILMPALLILAAISDKIIILLFTNKWSAAIPFMQVICVMNCFDILGAANLQALKAVGRADILLKLELYKKPIMIVILGICMLISPLAICIGQFIYSLYALVLNAFPNRKLINYPLREQFMDISVSLTISIITAIAVYFIGCIKINIYSSVVIQIIVGISLYLLLSIKWNAENFYYIKDTIIQSWNFKNK